MSYCYKVSQAKLVQYLPQSREHPVQLEKKRFFRQTSQDSQSHLIYYASLHIFVWLIGLYSNLLLFTVVPMVFLMGMIEIIYFTDIRLWCNEFAIWGSLFTNSRRCDGHWYFANHVSRDHRCHGQSPTEFANSSRFTGSPVRGSLNTHTLLFANINCNWPSQTPPQLHEGC